MVHIPTHHCIHPTLWPGELAKWIQVHRPESPPRAWKSIYNDLLSFPPIGQKLLGSWRFLITLEFSAALCFTASFLHIKRARKSCRIKPNQEFLGEQKNASWNLHLGSPISAPSTCPSTSILTWFFKASGFCWIEKLLVLSRLTFIYIFLCLIHRNIFAIPCTTIWRWG